MQTDVSRPISVARVIVQDSAGRVLVLQRAAGSTDGGRWCLPGGKIEYGDTAEQAAARELLEETGLQATQLEFLFYQDSPPRPGRMHFLTLYFLCRAEGELVLNEESTAAAWIGPDELAAYDLAFRNGEALERYWAL
jgi:mutator protein MutT